MIDRAAIAAAALEIGLGRVTMRRVADRLGVRAASLYHHVRSKRDLLQLAGSHSMASLVPPPDRGQHWAEWLRGFGRAGRASLLAQPELLQQIAKGELALDRVVDVVELALTVLTRQGFTASEAMEAFLSMAQCAIGSAVHETQERRALADVASLREELVRLLASRPDELGRLRGLAATLARPADYERLFERQMATLVIGLAARRGEDWRAWLAEPA